MFIPRDRRICFSLVLLMVLAGIFSWFYVIYFAITREPDETK